MNDASTYPASPLARYRAEVRRGQLQPDDAQAAAALETDRVFQALQARGDSAWLEPASSFASMLRGWLGSARPRSDTARAIKGLYLWGGVGRGKTHLMDLLFESLTVSAKLRLHFHEFMHGVHGELKTLAHRQDPLQIVADRLAAKAGVLCFDEFHVADITDAMLLGRLLDALFDRATVLVTTSNSSPDELYKDGLQRERFLPAIESIKRNTVVFHLDGATDYRLRALERAEIYHCPLDEEAEASLARSFASLSIVGGETGTALSVNGRSIPTRRCCEGVVWFDFHILCEGPRSTADYMDIARRFNTVLLGGVPRMDDRHADAALRFVHLVDEFYDRNVKLIVSADAGPAGLYSGKRLAGRFERTRSRLEEMRSHEYLARPHLP
ncbi:MAG: cell division protein ZapE [Gammaproteobacteria bacterium]